MIINNDTKQYINQSSQKINDITNDTIVNKQSQKEENTNIFNKLVDTTKNFFSKEYYTTKIDQYQQVTEQTSDYILQLIIAFVFKTIFFPLIFLFFLYQVLRGVFNVGK